MILIVLWNKEIDQSNLSTPDTSSIQNPTPDKLIRRKVDLSKRNDSYDSVYDSQRNELPCSPTQMTKGSNEAANQALLNKQQLPK